MWDKWAHDPCWTVWPPPAWWCPSCAWWGWEALLSPAWEAYSIRLGGSDFVLEQAPVVTG